MITEERLTEIETRASKATKSPWVRWSVEGPYPPYCPPPGPDAQQSSVCSHIGTLMSDDHRCVAVMVGKDEEQAAINSDFVASARDDVPDMVAEIRRLRVVLAAAGMAIESKRLELQHGRSTRAMIQLAKAIQEYKDGQPQ